MSQVRQLSAVPFVITGLLVIAITLQLSYKQSGLVQALQFKAMKEPMSLQQYNVFALGSNKLLAHMLTLQLQLHDNQFGKHINYHYLDYDVLVSRLIRLQELNTDSDYPAMLAARVFVNTNNKKQLEKVVTALVTLFELNPEGNWRWIAETTILAKYHLNNLSLALLMAKKISEQPKSIEIPVWARDLKFLILEELNQIDSAIYIVEQSLLDKDNLSNDEIRFLNVRLLALKHKLSINRQKN